MLSSLAGILEVLSSLHSVINHPSAHSKSGLILRLSFFTPHHGEEIYFLSEIAMKVTTRDFDCTISSQPLQSQPQRVAYHFQGSR